MREYAGSLGFSVVGREGCDAPFSTNHINSERANMRMRLEFVGWYIIGVERPNSITFFVLNERQSKRATLEIQPTSHIAWLYAGKKFRESTKLFLSWRDFPCSFGQQTPPSKEKFCRCEPSNRRMPSSRTGRQPVGATLSELEDNGPVWDASGTVSLSG